MAEQPAERLVLIAIDASEWADKAFDFYVKNLHREGNKVLLIHAAEPPMVPSQHAMYINGDLWEELLNQEKVKVKQLEDSFAQKMKENHISGKIRAVFASKAGETICDEAKTSHANMIIMGSRGLGTIRRTVLGSCSDYVLHHAHCPVIVCKH